MDSEALIRMANQIASFYEPYSDSEAEDGIATHIQKFWEPRMRDGLFATYRASPDAFKPRVNAAIARLMTET